MVVTNSLTWLTSSFQFRGKTLVRSCRRALRAISGLLGTDSGQTGLDLSKLVVLCTLLLKVVLGIITLVPVLRKLTRRGDPDEKRPRPCKPKDG